MAKKKIKEFNFNFAIKRIFSKTTLAKLNKANEQIASYVLVAEDEVRLRRLDQVLLSVHTKGQAIPVYKERGRILVNKINLELFERDEVDTFLQYAARYLWTQENYEPKHKEARNRLMFSFFNIAGETLERSMQLALCLLEHFHKYQTNFYNNSGNLSKEMTLGGSALYAIRISCASAPVNEMPAYRWLEKLFDDIEGNSSTSEVVVAILTLLVNLNKKKRIGIDWVLYDELTDHDRHEYLELCQDMQTEWYNERPHVCTTHDRAKRYLSYVEDYNQRHEVTEAKARALISKLSDDNSATDRSIEKIRDQIRGGFNYGFRPNAEDHIEITVPALWCVGLRSVSFNPSGCRPGDAALLIYARKLGFHLLQIPANVEDLQLKISCPGVFENNLGYNESTLTKLLEYVVLDTMRRLLVNGCDLPASTQQKKYSADRVSHGVRPHFMKLQSGHQPSQTAQNLALEQIGWSSLPIGKTFVRAHYRNGQLVYDLPSEPVMRYGEEQLQEALKVY